MNEMQKHIAAFNAQKVPCGKCRTPITTETLGCNYGPLVFCLSCTKDGIRFRDGYMLIAVKT